MCLQKKKCFETFSKTDQCTHTQPNKNIHAESMTIEYWFRFRFESVKRLHFAYVMWQFQDIYSLPSLVRFGSFCLYIWLKKKFERDQKYTNTTTNHTNKQTQLRARNAIMNSRTQRMSMVSFMFCNVYCIFFEVECQMKRATSNTFWNYF